MSKNTLIQPDGKICPCEGSEWRENWNCPQVKEVLQVNSPWVACEGQYQGRESKDSLEEKLEARLHWRLYDKGEDHNSAVLLNLLPALVLGHLKLPLGLFIIVSVFPGKVLIEFSIAKESLQLGNWGKREIEEGIYAAPFPRHQDLPHDEGEEERENQVKGAHSSNNNPISGIIEPVSIFEALLAYFLDLRRIREAFKK